MLVEAARSEFSGSDAGIIMSPLSKALNFSNIFTDRSFHIWVDLKAKFYLVTSSLTRGTSRISFRRDVETSLDYEWRWVSKHLHLKWRQASEKIVSAKHTFTHIPKISGKNIEKCRRRINLSGAHFRTIEN